MDKFNKLINDIKNDNNIPQNVHLTINNTLNGLRTNTASNINSNKNSKLHFFSFNKLKIATAVILVMLLLSAYLVAPILFDNNMSNNIASNQTSSQINSETDDFSDETENQSNTQSATTKPKGNSFYVVAYAGTTDENNSSTKPDNNSNPTVDSSVPDNSVPANNSELIFYSQVANVGVNGFDPAGLFKITGNNIKTVEFSIDRGAIFRMTRTYVSIEDFDSVRQNFFNHDPYSTKMYTGSFDSDIMMHVIDYHELLGNNFVESYNSELYYGLYITDEMTNPESSGLNAYEGVTVYEEYDGASITFRVTFDDGTVQELTYKLAYDPLYFLPNPGGSYNTDLIGCVLEDKRLLVHRMVGRLVEE